MFFLTQTVPYGVLCFFSSYKMLEKLTNRWQVKLTVHSLIICLFTPVDCLIDCFFFIQDTGLWYKMLHEKFIVSEPRSGKKEDFETAMTSFYSVVAESSPDRTAGNSQGSTQ